MVSRKLTEMLREPPPLLRGIAPIREHPQRQPRNPPKARPPLPPSTVNSGSESETSRPSEDPAEEAPPSTTSTTTYVQDYEAMQTEMRRLAGGPPWETYVGALMLRFLHCLSLRTPLGKYCRSRASEHFPQVLRTCRGRRMARGHGELPPAPTPAERKRGRGH